MTRPKHIIESQARSTCETLDQLMPAIFGEGRPADRVLAAHLRANRQFGSRDRRLISATLFAVLRWWGWLRPLAPRGVVAHPGDASQPRPRTRWEQWSAVALGAHLLDSDELPQPAQVWARHCAAASLLPPAQTTDRSLADRAEQLRALPTCADCALDPEDLVPSWSKALIECPRPLAELIEWCQRRPPVWLRLQTDSPESVLSELRHADIVPRPHAALADAVAIDPPRVNLRTLNAFRTGRLEIQDLASQTIAHICDPTPGQRWWDACAGAGGKALHLAHLMQGKGAVVASDIRTYKLDDLRKRARRARLSNIRCREWKGKRPPAQWKTFDGVLVDSPCSCSGTWRRNPDARWTTRPDDIDEFHALQLQLLTNAARAVKPGGRLVYATCSLFPQENAHVVSAFLRAEPTWRLDPFPHPLTAEPGTGSCQIWPWHGDCDAMFAARFIRAR